jgi:hypothetical protein
MSWIEDQEWERQWWGDCTNTFAEETKQITYAHRMGMIMRPDISHWPRYELQDQSIIDIGGGPTSLLLKCDYSKRSVVADPCTYPRWVMDRYQLKGIEFVQMQGERLIELFEEDEFDEAWMYNVLQHTFNPELIIKNAKKISKCVRIFEWINIPPCPGHPSELKEHLLAEWLGGKGEVACPNENGCNQMAFYGVFNKYE